MILPNTDITRRQGGVLRIEVVAIIMLLVALAIVLITDESRIDRFGNGRAGAPVQAIPAQIDEAVMPKDARQHWQQPVISEPDTP